jgi:hypothetical protein
MFLKATGARRRVRKETENISPFGAVFADQIRYPKEALAKVAKLV